MGRAYVINLDEYADVGTHWIVLFCNRNEVVYIDSFGVGDIPEEIKEFIDRPSSSALQNKNIKANFFWVQANDSVMCDYFCIGFIDFMLAGNKLTDYTSLFSPHDFKEDNNIILPISKMNKYNSIEAIDKTGLYEQIKFQLDEISKIENYFIEEINQRKSCSKKLSKYVAVFYYIDQTLLVLSATSGRVSIISFTSIVGAPVGIASASITLFFSLITGIVKKLLNIARKKRKAW